MGCERENAGDRGLNPGLPMPAPAELTPFRPHPSPLWDLPCEGVYVESNWSPWMTWGALGLGVLVSVSLNSDQIWDETGSHTHTPS